ncbi:conserved membrane hypothetical protein [Candidatus Desulfosporosinus infrequens]|uniref:Uncharacterized protein n=1 Tax=Candidatus Desulfosporosinus infrequens TaxID=2043169 RepID=A0A2U3L183_9FIRM|nr:conserved membrane hypothetical protein [Candidatus Desulfosporosinus infrequens]
MESTEKDELAAVLEAPVDNFIFNIGLADVLRLSMFGTLISVSRFFLMLPMGIPGWTSVFWMGLLVLGKGLIPKFGSGTIMGIVSGLLAIVFGLGKEGPLLALKCIVPGMLLDVLAIFFLYKLGSLWVGAIIGALISFSKLLASMALGVMLNTPMVFLAMGFGYATLLHVIFGAIGGGIATVLIKRLKPRLVSFW